jgi:hypothetical protein
MKKFVLFLFLSAIVLVAACTTDTTQNSQTATPDKQVATQQVKETAKQASNQPAATLKEIFSGAHVKYTADYTITSDGKTMATTYIMDLPKFAMVSTTEQGDTRSIYDGSTFVVCSQYQAQWQCFKMPVQTPDAVNTEKSVNDGTVAPVYLGQCLVASESGLKYSVTTKSDTSTVCYTTDGILLEMTTAKMTMTATKVSRTVAADAFTAPAEPTSIPTIPQ